MADYKQIDYRPLGSFGSKTANERVIAQSEKQLDAMRQLGIRRDELVRLLDMAKTLNRYIFQQERDDRAVR